MWTYGVFREILRLTVSDDEVSSRRVFDRLTPGLTGFKESLKLKTVH